MAKDFFIYIMLGSWAVWGIVWILGAFRAKKNAYLPKPTKTGAARFVFLWLLTLIIYEWNPVRVPLFPRGVAAYAVYAALVVAGHAFAIWARVVLGTSWSARPSLKGEHELATKGPYAFVRHPIYTGMFFAVAGSVLFEGYLRDVVLFAFIMFIFVTRISLEEKLMTEKFPDAYPEYKKKTKALIPFIV